MKRRLKQKTNQQIAVMFENEELDGRRANALRLLICGTLFLLWGGFRLLTHASGWAVVATIYGGIVVLFAARRLVKLRPNSGGD